MSAVTVRTQRVPHFLGSGQIGWHERPIPEPGPGELLIRPHANAICGSDRAQLTGGSAVTPGHEAAGEVVAAGPETSTAIGERGVVYLMDYCGACRSCQLGATNQCLAKRGDMGFTHDGGFGRFELVHETNFFPIGPEIAFAEATLLLDVMGTTSHALDRARGVRADIGSVAIAGAGPVGLGAVAMCRLLLGHEVTVLVTDTVRYRLDLAERLGATPIDVKRRGFGSTLHDVGLGQGVDAAIDTTGRETARRALLDGLGRRGVLVCVGHGEGLTLSVSSDLIALERAVLGSEYFRFDSLPSNLELLRRNRGYLGQIVTHRFDIADLQVAYQTFLGGATGKVVVEQ
jgi:threonine 3-dehydrogenase